jgi:hypothetical protein
MWANTVWGFICLAVAAGTLVLTGVSHDYLWVMPWLPKVTIFFLICSAVCFFWPLLKRLFLRPEHLHETSATLDALGPDVIPWIARMMTGARPIGIPDAIWQPLEKTGLFERDFVGPKGVIAEFRPAVTVWLKARSRESIQASGFWAWRRQVWPQYLMAISALGFLIGLVAFLQINVNTSTVIPTTAAKENTNKQVDQPDILDLFMTDFQLPQAMVWNASADIDIITENRKSSIRLFYNIITDAESNSKFIAFYIPHVDNLLEVVMLISREYRGYIDDVEKNHWAVMKSPGMANPTNTRETLFSGRVYIYYSDILSIEQAAESIKAFRSNGAPSIQFRGLDYMMVSWQSIKNGDKKPVPKYVIKDGVPRPTP